MTAIADPTDLPPKKKSKLPLLIGLVLAVAGGGGGFYAVQTGLIGGDGHQQTTDMHEDKVDPMPVLAFVPLDPLIISIPSSTGRSFLRFSAQLEVRPEHAGEVEILKPRIVDVLNGYLRTVEASELENPTALLKLRAQMLRRLQVVAGEGRIQDLLIMEFVLN